ncbi:MAG: inner-rane translocator [Frankiales bacterium]|nr:inner-rane translocator [Frankiales bacterium]
MTSSSISLLLVAAISLAAPLLYAALGETISENAGVINIQLEGMMLVGAFTGVYGAHVFHSTWLGFLCAVAGGVALAAVHGVACLVFRANQIVSGVVLNILALGATSYGLVVLLGSSAGNSVPTLARVRIPLLSSIPVIGPALFDQNVMVYVAFLLVPVVWWVLRRTGFGLALQAVGERPQAASSLGVAVARMRWLALLICGALAGLGGGQLTLAGLGAFTQNVTAGRGFIALAAVVFGGWRPWGVLGAILLFSTADAFQIRAQAFGAHIPYQFLAMLPYLVTILALAVLVRRRRAPSALGVNV